MGQLPADQDIMKLFQQIAAASNGVITMVEGGSDIPEPFRREIEICHFLQMDDQILGHSVEFYGLHAFQQTRLETLKQIFNDIVTPIAPEGAGQERLGLQDLALQNLRRLAAELLDQPKLRDFDVHAGLQKANPRSRGCYPEGMLSRQHDLD